MRGSQTCGVLATYLPPSASVAYGDAVVLSGQLQVAQPFKDDAGNEFDHAGYLEVENVSAVIARSFIYALSVSFRGALYSVKAAREND
ncbi:MAG: hypothetical protein ACREGH_02440 [Minisyncoccia bacterium]